MRSRSSALLACAFLASGNAFAQSVDAPTAVDSPTEIAGEIAIDVRDDLSAADLTALAKDYGLTFRANSPWSDAHDKLELASVNAADEDALLDRLSHDARVEFAERDLVYSALFVPNDPLYAERQWHMKSVGAERAWDYGCGRGVTVAVIDTGVACFESGPFSRGTDLSGTRCSGGYDFVNRRDNAADDQGHGTHVAGTIAQTTNNGLGASGLAYCANLMPVKVLSERGWGTLASVAEGIRFAADEGAQVINLSLGGPSPSRIIKSAIDHALDKGVIVVAAAGNSGGSVGYPAAYPGVIAVSAVDRNGNLAWFSSRGEQVTLAAPGVQVTQQTICQGGKNKCEIFGTFNGTSMASPHVAGAAALLVAEGVTDPHSVLAALTGSADPKADASRFGAGILQAGASLARAHWIHVFGRALSLLVLGFAIASRIRKKGGTFKWTSGGIATALLASTGLFAFAPLIPGLPRTGALSLPIDLLSHPIGEWDLASAASFHQYLPFGNALVVLSVFVLLFGVKRLRPALGGFALGTSAFLAPLMVVPDIKFVLGSLGLRVFAALNLAICLWIARVSLDAKKVVR